MSLEITCSNPACKKRHTLPDESAGQTVKCRACGETFIADPSVTTKASTKKAKADDFIEPAWESATSQRPAPPATVALGTNTVGRFVIRGKIGAGAFGTVYRAYDPQLDRVVALKVPNTGVMDTPKRVERFLREAKAAAQLRHPHIVPVFDAGQDGDRYYIACAFIDGKPLSEAIPESGMELDRAAKLVRELAEALAYAHEQGVVHRDVKPQNVMLDKLDRVHLMDFGLAARQEAEARLTNDGAVMGTPSYMAPEQAKGQVGEVLPATDQYAVGVVLYELLTGRAPFVGPTPVVLHNVVHTEPEPPSKHRPEVPKDLETICLKAMSKRPEDRYASCQELADDLRRWQEDEPVSARPLRSRERFIRWVKKEPKLAVAAALVAVMFVVSIVLVSNAARRADAARREVEALLAQAKPDGSDAPTPAPPAPNPDALAALQKEVEVLRTQVDDERKKAATERKKADEARAALLRVDGAIPQLAHKIFQTGDVAVARLLLQLVPADRREWEWRYVQKVCDAPPGNSHTVFKGHTNSISSVSFNHDGSLIVTASNDRSSRVWNAKTGELIATFADHTNAVCSAAFNPNGSLVVSASDDKTARVWNSKTGKDPFTLTHTSFVNSACFNKDSSRIVTAGSDNTARVWSIDERKELFPLNGHTDSVFFAVFSPDDSRIVTASYDNTARVWDATNGKELFPLKGHTDDVHSAVFSTDGSRIVTAGSDNTARVWDAKTGEELFSLTGHTRVVYCAVFNADGSRIATASNDNTVKLWDAKTGKELLTLKYTSSVHAVAWSPDGSRLAVALGTGTVEVLDDGTPAAPAPVPKLPDPKAPMPKPPDAKLPAAPMPAGKIDPVKLVGKWKVQSSGATAEFTEDGKYILTLSSGGKVDGTYTLDGDQLYYGSKKVSDGKADPATITKLTDDELVTQDKNGKVTTRSRIKP